LLPSGSLPQLEALLGFPPWFRDGTRLGPPDRPFPDAVTITDGMRVVANICENGAVPKVLAAIMRAPRVLHTSGWSAGAAFAPSLGDALAGIVERFPTSNPFMRLALHADGGRAVVAVTIDAAVPRFARSYVGMGALFLIYREVQPYGGDAMRECLIESAADASPDLAALQELLEAELRFGADAYRLRFPESWLRRRNPQAEPQLWRALASMDARQAPGPTPLAQDVSALVRNALEGGERLPRLAEAAMRLTLSERTLVRRLTQAGTSYLRLVDSERRALASRLIADPALSLQQIADRLAYGDRQGFGRAFRGWFGESPGRFRRRLRTGGDALA
jgi:AraC-like DNA-binding protein